MKTSNKEVNDIVKDFPENISELIINLHQTKDSISRIEAKNRLEKKGRSVLPYLNKLLVVEDNLLRREIAKIMEYIADKTTIPVFINLLDDDDSGMRWIAAEGLIRIGRDCIAPLLKSILDDQHESYFLRLGAHHVFKSLFTDDEKLKMNALMRSLQHYLEIGVTVSIETLNALKTFEAKEIKSKI